MDKSVFSCDVIGVGVILNHPDPAVLRLSLTPPPRFLFVIVDNWVEEEKVVGRILGLFLPPMAPPPMPVILWDVVSSRNDAHVVLLLPPPPIAYMAASIRDVRLRNSDRLVLLLLLMSPPSRRIGAV